MVRPRRLGRGHFILLSRACAASRRVVERCVLIAVLTIFIPCRGLNGAPETIRTSGLCLRRATLYPAELRAQ